MWIITLYGRVTGDAYPYEVKMSRNEDLRAVINDAFSQHSNLVCFFPADVGDGEFADKNRFGLEWKEDEK